MKRDLHKVLQGIMILAFALGLAMPGRPVQAATCTWTGAVSRDWETAGNWSCARIPNGADDVVIPDVARDILITTSIDRQVNNLTINAGGVLEATASYSGSGRLNLVAQGTLVINNGTIKITGTIESAAITIYTSGQFINNGTIDINAGIFNAYFYASSTQTGAFSGQYGGINLHGYTGVTLTFSPASTINVRSISFDYVPTVNIHGTLWQIIPGSSFSISRSVVNYYMTSQPYMFGEVYLDSTYGGELNCILGGVIIGSYKIPPSARLTGTGSITGNLESEGTVSPGTSPGTITVEGNYTQAETGVLEIELGGTVPDTGYDQLAVTGLATLGGTLKVSLVAPFAPALGQTFDILTYGSRSGEFVTLDLPALGAGLAWQTTYEAAAVRLEVVVSLGSISGTVTCAGSLAGSAHTVFVDLWTDPSTPPPLDAQQIACGGSYTFDELADGTYYVDAWLDLNESGGGPPDENEPYFWYGAPDPVTVTGGAAVTGIDITVAGGSPIYLPMIQR
jgi:hypothetical protein